MSVSSSRHPWRSQALNSSEGSLNAPHSGESRFTQMAAEDNDRHNLILWRGSQVFVALNQQPYNNGHLLIIPYRKVTTYQALTSQERLALTRAIDRSMGWLREVVSPHGFNVGINEGRFSPEEPPISHIHAHIIPRWNGDTNFMPVVNNTKVIPESLDDTYEQLRNVVDAQTQQNR